MKLSTSTIAILTILGFYTVLVGAGQASEPNKPATTTVQVEKKPKTNTKTQARRSHSKVTLGKTSK